MWLTGKLANDERGSMAHTIVAIPLLGCMRLQLHYLLCCYYKEAGRSGA